MSKDTGGFAFPGCATINRDTGEFVPHQFGNNDFMMPGMTLRDYFASKAIAGILANPDISASAARCKVSTEQFRSDTVAAAFALADAMLAEGAK